VKKLRKISVTSASQDKGEVLAAKVSTSPTPPCQLPLLPLRDRNGRPSVTDATSAGHIGSVLPLMSKANTDCEVLPAAKNLQVGNDQTASSTAHQSHQTPIAEYGSVEDELMVDGPAITTQDKMSRSSSSSLASATPVSSIDRSVSARRSLPDRSLDTHGNFSFH
jgi:hypothetical protein